MVTRNRFIHSNANNNLMNYEPEGWLQLALAYKNRQLMFQLSSAGLNLSQITTTQLSRWTLNSLLHFFIRHGSNQIFCRIRSYCCRHCTCGRITCTRVSFFIYCVIDAYFLSDRVVPMLSTCKPVTTWSPATTRTLRSWCKSLFFVVEMLL